MEPLFKLIWLGKLLIANLTRI